MELARHRFLVTGGTRGIGLELSRALAGRGAKVAVVGRDPSGLAEVEKALPGVVALQADLARIDGLPALADRVRQVFGPPTVLVNNAGVQRNHDWIGTPSAERVGALESEIAVNLTSPLALTALFLDDLVAADEAAIVNLSSLLALTPKRSAPVYCATKAGIRAFGRGLAYQLESHPNLRVVEVVPPLVDTGMTAGRGTGKISPAEAANEIVRGLERDQTEILVGKSRLVTRLHRWLPGLVARMLKDG